MEARLTLAPATRLVVSPYPVHAIWRANTEAGAPPAAGGAEAVLVTRPDWDPKPRGRAAGRRAVRRARCSTGTASAHALEAAGDALDLAATPHPAHRHEIHHPHRGARMIQTVRAALARLDAAGDCGPAAARPLRLRRRAGALLLGLGAHQGRRRALRPVPALARRLRPDLPARDGGGRLRRLPARHSSTGPWSPPARWPNSSCPR